jgi:hypothetical protein
MDQEYLFCRYYEELGRASEADSPVAKQGHEARWPELSRMLLTNWRRQR